MPKLIKKIIPYFFTLIILIGLFIPTTQVSAQIQQPGTFGQKTEQQTAIEIANQKAEADKAAAASAAKNANDPFKGEIIDGCGVSPLTWFNGCLLLVIYYTYFQLPSMILWVSAQFFNAMVNLGIDSVMTASSGFISAAWTVVRDFANISFILILLYIAIQTILGLGHETKKMIVRVVVLAMLINFSMFFSKVVIDASNILALVFYNKLEINESRPSDAPAALKQKDISGEMWRTFDATKLINAETIKKLKTTTIKGEKIEETKMPFSLTLGIMVIAGSIMLWAAYAFFIAGLMFIGRLIELWVLIIFSPFAFMSSTLPHELGHIEYIGWDSWLKRLISTSFMAPIFMFFMYLIFMLLPKISDFQRGDNLTILGTILNILIPAIVVMALLKKATEFAKKGGGQFGEMAMKYANMAAGLVGTAALGVASGGTALVARGVIGGAVGTGVGKLAEKVGKYDGRVAKFTSSGLSSTKKFLQTSTFDARNAPKAIESLVKKGNMFEVQEGGWKEMTKKQQERRKKKADELEEEGTHHEHENLEHAELELKAATLPVKLELENADEEIKKAREKLKDAINLGTATEDQMKKLKTDFEEAKANKEKIEQRTDNPTGKSIEDLKKEVKAKKSALNKASAEIRKEFANEIDKRNSTKLGKFWNTMRRLGAYSVEAEKEAARKIRAGEHYSGGGKGGGHDKKEEKHDHAPAAKKDHGGEHGGGHGGGGGGHGEHGGGHGGGGGGHAPGH